MSEKLCLQWNDFNDNVTSSFESLRENGDFADVTLACEDGKQVEAHKVILASSSPFFQRILRRNAHPHPLIYMTGIKSDNLLAIIDFLYCGEANIYQKNLDSFLAIAEELQLKGLMGKTENTADVIQKDSFKMPDAAAQVKQESNVLETVPPNHSKIFANEVDFVVAGKNDFSVDFQKLDQRTNLTMEKTSRTTPSGPIYVCKVCGKEGRNAQLKAHIQANHLEGVSLSCNFCEKTFRCKNLLTMHENLKHKGPNIC